MLLVSISMPAFDTLYATWSGMAAMPASLATFTITRAGTYTVTSTVTFAYGTTTKATSTVNVTAAAGTGC